MAFSFGLAYSNRPIAAANNRKNGTISHYDAAHCALTTLVESAATHCSKAVRPCDLISILL